MLDGLVRLWQFVRFVCKTPQSWRDEWGHDVSYLVPWQRLWQNDIELDRLRRRVEELEAGSDREVIE